MPHFHAMRLPASRNPSTTGEWIFKPKIVGFRRSRTSRRTAAHSFFATETCSSLGRSSQLTSRTQTVRAQRSWTARFAVRCRRRSDFRNLLFRRESPFFLAFDVLALNGDDLRGPLVAETQGCAETNRAADRWSPSSRGTSAHFEEERK